jgi:hypothetical protein
MLVLLHVLDVTVEVEVEVLVLHLQVVHFIQLFQHVLITQNGYS